MRLGGTLAVGLAAIVIAVAWRLSLFSVSTAGDEKSTDGYVSLYLLAHKQMKGTAPAKALGIFERILALSDADLSATQAGPSLEEVKSLVHVDICGLYGTMFRHQDAIRCASDQISSAGSSGGAHPNLFNFRGVALASIGDIDGAIENFDTVVDICKDEGRRHCNSRIVADALNSKGAALWHIDIRRARDAFVSALEHVPAHNQAKQNLHAAEQELSQNML